MSVVFVLLVVVVTVILGVAEILVLGDTIMVESKCNTYCPYILHYVGIYDDNDKFCCCFW